MQPADDGDGDASSALGGTLPGPAPFLAAAGSGDGSANIPFWDLLRPSASPDGDHRDGGAYGGVDDEGGGSDYSTGHPVIKLQLADPLINFSLSLRQLSHFFIGEQLYIFFSFGIRLTLLPGVHVSETESAVPGKSELIRGGGVVRKGPTWHHRARAISESLGSKAAGHVCVVMRRRIASQFPTVASSESRYDRRVIVSRVLVYIQCNGTHLCRTATWLRNCVQGPQTLYV